MQLDTENENALVRLRARPTPEGLAALDDATAVEWDRRQRDGWDIAEGPALFDLFDSAEYIAQSFDLPDALEGAELLAAYYTDEDYEGTAEVYFRRDGVIYEVHGSHCSCNGLEGQWRPEVVQIDELRARMIREIIQREEEHYSYNRDPAGFAPAVLNRIGWP